MKMTKKSITFGVCCFLVFMAEALSYCFMMTYLISLGYSTMQRSIIFAALAISLIIGQVLVGYFCDKMHAIKPMAFILLVIYLLFNAVFYLYPGHNFIVHLILAAVAGSMMNITDGMFDSWVLESDEECRQHYGAIRAQGSVGWAIGSPLAAGIVARFGYQGLAGGFAILAVIIMAICYTIPDAKKAKTAYRLKLKDTGKLLKHRHYRLAIIILFFIFLIGNMCNYAVIDKLSILNATSLQISWCWTLQAVVELPMFFLGDYFSKKFGLTEMLGFAAGALGVRYVLYGLAGSTTQMILLGLMQFFSFGLMMVGAKRIIDERTSLELKTSGQQLAMALYNGGSLLVSPLLSGGLETMFGIDMALIVIGCISIIPIILLSVYRHLPEKSQA